MGGDMGDSPRDAAGGTTGGTVGGTTGGTAKQAAGAAKRVIKRYSNRKLYDTKDSRYVTLQQIGELVRQGEDVQIIDNKTKQDKTEVTLALILSEDLKTKPSSVPLGTLRHLIQERGERILSQLRDGPIGRFIPAEDGEEQCAGEEGPQPEKGDAAVKPAASGSGDERPTAKVRLDDLKKSMDEFQSSLDERVKMLVPGTRLIRELQVQITALTSRVEELERKLAEPGEKTN
jgi:polyhydroxyalkanoate synthesis repressor PhaR